MTFLSRLQRDRDEARRIAHYSDADELHHLIPKTTSERVRRTRGIPVVGGGAATLADTDPDKIDWDKERPLPVEPPPGKLSPQVHHPHSPRGPSWRHPDRRHR